MATTENESPPSIEWDYSAWQPGEVGFATMYGKPEDGATNDIYVGRCPHCGDRHEWEVRAEEWTGRTASKQLLMGASRDCPYTGEPIRLIVARHRSLRHGGGVA